MAVLTGKIVDAATGDRVEARVQVIGPGGDLLAPSDAMWKVGPGEPFFYSDGEFSLDVPRGYVQVVVERGTEYTPWRGTVEAGASGVLTLDVELERWPIYPTAAGTPATRTSTTTRTRATPTAACVTTRASRTCG